MRERSEVSARMLGENQFSCSSLFGYQTRAAVATTLVAGFLGVQNSIENEGYRHLAAIGFYLPAFIALISPFTRGRR